MNSLPRWLISITHMPVPCQSSISSPARASTSSGSTAGPALKLKMRAMSVQRGTFRRDGRRAGVAVAAVTAIAAVLARAVAVLVAVLDARDAGELLALRQRDQRDALRRAAHFPDLRHRGADQHPAGG